MHPVFSMRKVDNFDGDTRVHPQMVLIVSCMIPPSQDAIYNRNLKDNAPRVQSTIEILKIMLGGDACDFMQVLAGSRRGRP